MFLSCFLLSIFTSRLQLLIFLHSSRICSAGDDFFSIKKGDSLAKEFSSSDSITINLGNYVIISFSRSDPERFHLAFLFVFAYMCFLFCFVFSLILCSITDHRDQLLLGIYQREYPFALVDMENIDQYTCGAFQDHMNFRFAVLKT